MRRILRIATTVRSGAPSTPPGPDQFALFADDFESGETDIEDRGWSWFLEGVITGQAIVDGELDLQIDTGGAAGAFWFNDNDGPLASKTLEGDVDVRMRCRVTNATADGLPDPSQFRIAGLAAHDPDRSSVLNYVHIGGGSTMQAGNRVEWKDTIDSSSTFGDNGVDLLALDLDLRIVRTGQSFAMMWRPSAGALSSDDDWSTVQTIDRAADPMPDVLDYGAMIYSNDETPGIRVFVDEMYAQAA